MDFLLEEGFSEELIQKIKRNYDESAIDIFRLEQENVVDVIHYFQKIGIKKIDLLLQTRLELFTKDINEIKDVFLKYNIKELVDGINNDITLVDRI